MTGLRTHKKKKKACITGANTGFFFSPSALPQSHRQILCKQRKERKWVKCPERWREPCTFSLSACRRSPLCQIMHLSLHFRHRAPDERHQHNPAVEMITFPDNKLAWCMYHTNLPSGSLDFYVYYSRHVRLCRPYCHLQTKLSQFFTSTTWWKHPEFSLLVPFIGELSKVSLCIKKKTGLVCKIRLQKFNICPFFWSHN